MRVPLACLALVTAAQAQSFDVATLKPSAHPVGKDDRGALLLEPTRVSARNVSVQYLIEEAYHVQPFQVTNGPRWLDLDEFDFDARSGHSFTADQLRPMLQSLLAERLHLALHRDTKEMRAYILMVDKGGAKLRPSVAPPQPSTSPENFHGDMRQFANLISIGLTIQMVDDPTRPAIASGAPAPVIDETGLPGRYDISVRLARDTGDPFTTWQNALREQLGLRLEGRREPVEVLVIDRVDRSPAGN